MTTDGDGTTSSSSPEPPRRKPALAYTAQAFAAVDDWRSLLRVTDKGAIRAEVDNACIILEHDPRWQGLLEYDEFVGVVRKRRSVPEFGREAGEWSDADTISTLRWLTRNYGVQPAPEAVLASVLHVAQHRVVHPVRDWLNALVWDGTPRLRYWLGAYLGAEAPTRGEGYLELVGTLWLTSAVARVFEPGCKVDQVLVLEGRQRLGKSTALRILCGHEWFMDTPFRIGDKDAFQALRGKWIVELAEMDSFSRAESSAAKAFFSSPADHYRAAYGRIASTVPRQCVFAGTVNLQQYLRDPTGNRRYMPVRCGAMALTGEDSLAAAREQLWAEAVHHYRTERRWWPEGDEWELLTREQEEREETDAWADSITRFLLDDPEVMTGHRVTMEQLLGRALGLETSKWTRPEQTRVGAIMNRLGWRKRRSGHFGYFYEEPDEWRKKMTETEST